MSKEETNHEISEIAFDHFLTRQRALMNEVIKSPLIENIAAAPVLMAMVTTVLELAIPLDHLCLNDQLKPLLMKVIEKEYSGKGLMYTGLRQKVPTMPEYDRDIVSKILGNDVESEEV